MLLVSNKSIDVSMSTSRKLICIIMTYFIAKSSTFLFNAVLNLSTFLSADFGSIYNNSIPFITINTVAI